jgi:hypothetical protein
MEEWRMSRDAGGRSAEAHWKLIMDGSLYADRLPIGRVAISVFFKEILVTLNPF